MPYRVDSDRKIYPPTLSKVDYVNTHPFDFQLPDSMLINTTTQIIRGIQGVALMLAHIEQLCYSHSPRGILEVMNTTENEAGIVPFKDIQSLFPSITQEEYQQRRLVNFSQFARTNMARQEQEYVILKKFFQWVLRSLPGFSFFKEDPRFDIKSTSLFLEFVFLRSYGFQDRIETLVRITRLHLAEVKDSFGRVPDNLLKSAHVAGIFSEGEISTLLDLIKYTREKRDLNVLNLPPPVAFSHRYHQDGYLNQSWIWKGQLQVPSATIGNPETEYLTVDPFAGTGISSLSNIFSENSDAPVGPSYWGNLVVAEGHRRKVYPEMTNRELTVKATALKILAFKWYKVKWSIVTSPETPSPPPESVIPDFFLSIHSALGGKVEVSSKPVNGSIRHSYRVVNPELEASPDKGTRRIFAEINKGKTIPELLPREEINADVTDDF